MQGKQGYSLQGRLLNLIEKIEDTPFNAMRFLGTMCLLGLIRFVIERSLCSDYLMTPAGIINCITFFILSGLFFTLPISLLLRQPWHRTLQVVTIGLYFDLLPPLIDTFRLGPGRCLYGYFLPDKHNLSFAIYSPPYIDVGESVVLWTAVIMMAGYVWLKTRSVLRSAAAFILIYISIFVVAGLAATISMSLYSHFIAPSRLFSDNPFVHRAFIESFTATGEIWLAIGAYLALNRRRLSPLLDSLWNEVPHLLLVGLGALACRWAFLDENIAPPLALGITLIPVLWVIQARLAQRAQRLYSALPAERKAAGALSPELQDLHFFNLFSWMSAVLATTIDTRVGCAMIIVNLVSTLFPSDYCRSKAHPVGRYVGAGVSAAGIYMTGVYFMCPGDSIVPFGVMLCALLPFAGGALLMATVDLHTPPINGQTISGLQSSERARRRLEATLRVAWAITLALPALLAYRNGSPAFSVLTLCILPMAVTLFLVGDPKTQRRRPALTVTSLSIYLMGVGLLFW